MLCAPLKVARTPLGWTYYYLFLAPPLPPPFFAPPFLAPPAAFFAPPFFAPPFADFFEVAISCTCSFSGLVFSPQDAVSIFILWPRLKSAQHVGIYKQIKKRS